MTDEIRREQTRGGGHCANCCFYDPLYGETSTGIQVPVTVGGVCRKRSPTRMFETEPLHPDAVSNPRPAIWPMTAANDWCGDHPLRAASAAYETTRLIEEIRQRTKAFERERARSQRARDEERARQGGSTPVRPGA